MTEADALPGSPGPEVPGIPLSVSTYLRLRGLSPAGRYGRKKRRPVDDENLPFSPGRDPRPLGDAIDALAAQSGWKAPLAQEDLVRQWADLAGADTARHSEPVSLEQGMLTVKCDSTAWAKNLQFMRATILTEITRRYPEAGVQNLRFIGPDVPSWKWGRRAVPGRGPRDTYG